MAQGTTTSIEDRALQLLGTGIGPEVVANALGVTVARISQLLSDEHFSARVSELRFENLSKHNVRDSKYDSLEDELLDKLGETLPLIHRPMEIVKAISTINAAKRRGSSAPDSITQQHTVLNIVLPTQVLQKFITNINNQVVQVGDKDLVTIQSGSLLKQTKERLQAALAAPDGRITNEGQQTPRTIEHNL